MDKKNNMIYGFLNINKPKWKTSFDVIRDLRYITKINKMGHTGTLDPLAEGVLVIAIEEATKLIEFLMKNDKEYSAELILGSVSDTYDAQGQIEESGSRKPTLKEITKVLEKFKGDIDQVPPAFSAIRVGGKRAYQLAREGKEVKLKSRKVHVSDLKLISYKYPSLKIDVTCSSGTYIRSLANDIGKELKVGAYLNDLIRIRVGKFNLENSLLLEDIAKKGINECIIPVEEVFNDVFKIDINKEEFDALGFGQPIKREEIPENIEIFAAFFNNKLVGMLERFRDQVGLLKYKRKLNI